ncbi:MAG: hypothetical protein LBF54_02795 [Holosporaceae bacterium]|jgi:hypothetical protein|nr:hypothetical protein [Holosporaceae bacterium]
MRFQAIDSDLIIKYFDLLKEKYPENEKRIYSKDVGSEAERSRNHSCAL